MTSTPTPPHTPAARPQRTRGSTSPPTRSAAETACSANPPPPSSPRGSRLLNLTPTPTPTPSFTARQRHSSPTTHPPLICSPTAPTRSPLLSASPLSSTPGRLGLQWLTLTPPCPDPGSSLFCCGVQPAAACWVVTASSLSITEPCGRGLSGQNLRLCHVPAGHPCPVGVMRGALRPRSLPGAPRGLRPPNPAMSSYAVIRHRVNSVFCSHSATPALSPAPPIPPDCTPVRIQGCIFCFAYLSHLNTICCDGSGPAPPCTFLLLCCRWEFCAPAP
jgi:hypothetical protein